MCWALASGLVLANPLSDRPPLGVELEPELEFELLDPQADTTIAQATATSGMSVSRDRRM
jgi:hypothetical protein